MNRKGVLMVVSGPSGVGKDTVIEDFKKLCPTITSSVSATTRAPRPGEVHGVHYFFLQKDEFKAMVDEGDFLEYAVTGAGDYYGTPKKFVNDMLEEGKDILLKIDVQGAVNVKKAFPEAALVIIAPPSMKELWRRLVSRGTETREQQLKRIETAYTELTYTPHYDYVVVNDRLDEAVAELAGIYGAEQRRRSLNSEFCENLLKERFEDEVSSDQ